MTHATAPHPTSVAQTETPIWIQRYTESVMNTFGPPKLVLERGQGAAVVDVDGKSYLDLLGGIAVNVLGHAHPAVVEAVTAQFSTLGHISNLFASQPQIALAESLLSKLGQDGRVFFTNSGAEANEAAFKAARRTGRTHLVATEGAFHGRTMGALSVTHKPAFREPFEPLPGQVTFVPYGDADALAQAVTAQTAAVVIEPVLGEAGVVIPPRDYLRRAREITTAHGSLLWLDEIQTGTGRTGTWFAHQNPSLTDGEVVPDLVTLAKGLGGGFPIGACIGVGPAGELLAPGNHGSTFAGNPPACAVALAVLEVIEREGLLGRASMIGSRLAAGLGADDRVVEVRNAGALVGLTLTQSRSAQVVQAALDAGFIINNPAPDRIRMAPPLVITDGELDHWMSAWPTILDTAYDGDA